MNFLTSRAATSPGALNSAAICGLISSGECPAANLFQILKATRFISKAGRPAISKTVFPSAVDATLATPDICMLPSPLTHLHFCISACAEQLLAFRPSSLKFAQLLKRHKDKKQSLVAFWD